MIDFSLPNSNSHSAFIVANDAGHTNKRWCSDPLRIPPILTFIGGPSGTPKVSKGMIHLQKKTPYATQKQDT